MKPEFDNDTDVFTEAKRKLFRPEFSLGTLLQIGVMVFISGGIFYTSRQDIANITQRMDAMERSHNEAHREDSTKLTEVIVKVERLETQISDDRINRDRRNRSPRDNGNIIEESPEDNGN